MHKKRSSFFNKLAHILICFLFVLLNGSHLTAQKCSSIKQWLSKFEEEYPNPKTLRNGYEKYLLANLFREEGFVNFMGKSFTDLDGKKRIKLENKIKSCVYKNPLDNYLHQKWFTSLNVSGDFYKIVRNKTKAHQEYLNTIKKLQKSDNNSTYDLIKFKERLNVIRIDLWPSEASSLERIIDNKLKPLLVSQMINEIESIDVSLLGKETLLRKLFLFEEENKKYIKYFYNEVPFDVNQVLDSKKIEMIAHFANQAILEIEKLSESTDIKSITNANNIYWNYRNMWYNTGSVSGALNSNQKRVFLKLKELRTRLKPIFITRLKQTNSIISLEQIASVFDLDLGVRDDENNEILKIKQDQINNIKSKEDKLLKKEFGDNYAFIAFDKWEELRVNDVLKKLFNGKFEKVKRDTKTKRYALIFFTKMTLDNSKSCIKKSPLSFVYGGVTRTRSRGYVTISKDTILMPSRYVETFKKNGFNGAEAGETMLNLFKLFAGSSSSKSNEDSLNATYDFVQFTKKYSCDCKVYSQLQENLWRFYNSMDALQKSNSKISGMNCD